MWLTENQEPTLTISGTALVGQTLTAVIGEPDGLPADDQITYQWIRDDGTTETDISGATSSTYTLVDDDEDKTIKVAVSYTDNANFAESLTSEPTAIVTSGPSVASVTVSNITRDSADVTVTINNPESTSQTVYLRYQKAAETAWTSGGFKSTTSTSVEFSLSSLDGNTDYDVRASLESDFSAGIVEKSFKTDPIEPEPPSNVILGILDQPLAATWTAPSSDGGSSITGYVVQWKSGSQSFDSSRRATPTALSYVITGLTNGDEYSVRVAAVNNVGQGGWSDTEKATPIGPPDAPGGVVARSGDTKLTVSWNAPNNRGKAITGYTVQWKHGNRGWDPNGRQETLTGTPPATSYTIENLTNETEYTVRVRAINSEGNSDWSEAEGTPRSGPAVASVNVKQPIKCTVSSIALEFANLDPETQYQAHLRFRAQSTQSWTVLWPQGFWSSGIPELAAQGKLNGASPTFTLTDLDYGVTDEVQAALDSGFVDGLATTSFSTPDLSEVGFLPLSPGNNVLRTRWHEPTSKGRVVGYLVQWKSGDEEYDGTDTSERQADVPGSGDGEHTITGLGNGVGVPSEEFKGTPQPPPTSPAEGAPAISGTAQAGETLTAETDGINDADGLSNVAYSYQWLAGDVEIAGATDSNYTLAATDEGKTVKVKVSFTDDASNKEALTSEATVAVEPKANSPSTGQPTISGTAQVGETLTAETDGINDADGMDNASFSYQWLADDLEIAGAADSTYALVDADEGKTVKVKVSFNDDAENEATLTSEPTAAVAAKPRRSFGAAECSPNGTHHRRHHQQPDVDLGRPRRRHGRRVPGAVACDRGGLRQSAPGRAGGYRECFGAYPHHHGAERG